MSSPNVNFEFEVNFSPPAYLVDKLNESNLNDNSIMVLTSFQDELSLICQRVPNSGSFDKQFNFSNMVNNEFLADVKLRASNDQIVNFFLNLTLTKLNLILNTN